MCFRGLVEPLSTGQVTAVMAQTVKSSEFVVDPSYAGSCLSLLVVAIKGIVSIDRLVDTTCPHQLNYGTHPKCAMILRRQH
jgi:hypothetical protein